MFGIGFDGKFLLADLNPIGGISKADLKKFIAYAEVCLQFAHSEKVSINLRLCASLPCFQFPQCDPNGRIRADIGNIRPGR